MQTIDLHFHANIHGLGRQGRDARLAAYAAEFERMGLGAVASTEHSYKEPLEAYLRLADAAQGTGTSVLPGVEAVSCEGIDMIFLFAGEEELRRGLPRLRSFRWSIFDTALLARDLDAVTVVPHPFSISRSAAGNCLSHRGYLHLLSNVDYVEVHNGSALSLENRLSLRMVRPCFRKTGVKVRWTLDLPLGLRGHDLGWAIGTDAHFPGEQFIVGSFRKGLLQDQGQDRDIFDLLRQRHRFKPHKLKPTTMDGHRHNRFLLRSLGGVMREGLAKKRLRFNQRVASLSSMV